MSAAAIWRRERVALAPLVGGSDLSYRLLARKYGARITFTEMCIAEYFLNPDRCANKRFHYEFDPSDRPCFLQLAGNRAEPIIEMANMELFKGKIDAVDINCGCPQGFALSKGVGAGILSHRDYGADHLVSMCGEIANNIPYPLTVKMRIYNNVQDTVALCRRLREVGVEVVTLHGRFASQKGSNRGVCSWDTIKQLRDGTRDSGLVIVGNGDIRTYKHIQQILNDDICDGVMIGYGGLRDPRVFSPIPTTTPTTTTTTTTTTTDTPLRTGEIILHDTYIPPTTQQLSTTIKDYLQIALVHFNQCVDILRHINWLSKHNTTKEDKKSLFLVRSFDELINTLKSMSVSIVVEKAELPDVGAHKVLWPKAKSASKKSRREHKAAKRKFAEIALSEANEGNA